MGDGAGDRPAPPLQRERRRESTPGLGAAETCAAADGEAIRARGVRAYVRRSAMIAKWLCAAPPRKPAAQKNELKRAASACRAPTRDVHLGSSAREFVVLGAGLGKRSRGSEATPGWQQTPTHSKRSTASRRHDPIHNPIHDSAQNPILDARSRELIVLSAWSRRMTRTAAPRLSEAPDPDDDVMPPRRPTPRPSSSPPILSPPLHLALLREFAPTSKR